MDAYLRLIAGFFAFATLLPLSHAYVSPSPSSSRPLRSPIAEGYYQSALALANARFAEALRTAVRSRGEMIGFEFYDKEERPASPGSRVLVRVSDSFIVSTATEYCIVAFEYDRGKRNLSSATVSNCVPALR